MATFNNSIKQYLPGLLLAVIIAFSGKFLANFIPNLGGVTIAIIIGIIIGNLIKNNQNYDPGITLAKKKILSLAIILMGLKLKISVLSQLGYSAILIVISMVISALIFGYIAGKIFKLPHSFSMLLGIGTGICGSSAIGATAPLISDNEEEIGLSIGVINLLGTIGIFLLPLLTYFLNLSPENSGIMIGGSLQAVGQVVAAGFSISDKIGNLATVVKMGRVLMLGPVVLGLSLLKNKTGQAKSKVNIPPFIIGFFIFSIIGSLNILPSSISGFLKNSSKLLLTIAMAGIGLKIKLSSLFDQGPKALIAGIMIFVGQLILISFLISL